jgi:hypothetical protein
VKSGSQRKSTSEARHVPKPFVTRLALPAVVALIAATAVAVGASFFYDPPDALQFVV